MGHSYVKKLFIVYQTYSNLPGCAVFYLLPRGLGEEQAVLLIREVRGEVCECALPRNSRVQLILRIQGGHPR